MSSEKGAATPMMGPAVMREHYYVCIKFTGDRLLG